jgi:hypothetical protein
MAFWTPRGPIPFVLCADNIARASGSPPHSSTLFSLLYPLKKQQPPLARGPGVVVNHLTEEEAVWPPGRYFIRTMRLVKLRFPTVTR